MTGENALLLISLSQFGDRAHAELISLEYVKGNPRCLLAPSF